MLILEIDLKSIDGRLIIKDIVSIKCAEYGLDSERPMELIIEFEDENYANIRVSEIEYFSIKSVV